MECGMTILTDEEQTLMGAIGTSRVSTPGAAFARVVGIDFDGHRPLDEGFVSNHALQFGKGPFGVDGIGFALFLPGFFATLAPCALTNMGQILQANQGMGMLLHYLLTDDMIGILLQPSLSSPHLHQSSGRRTSAFALKTLPQSCIVIGFGNHGPARMKATYSFGRTRDRQVTYPHIDAHDLCLRLRCWVGHFH